MTHIHKFFIKENEPNIVSCECGIIMSRADKERIDRENLPKEVSELFGTLRGKK